MYNLLRAKFSYTINQASPMNERTNGRTIPKCEAQNPERRMEQRMHYYSRVLIQYEPFVIAAVDLSYSDRQYSTTRTLSVSLWVPFVSLYYVCMYVRATTWRPVNHCNLQLTTSLTNISQLVHRLATLVKD